MAKTASAPRTAIVVSQPASKPVRRGSSNNAKADKLEKRLQAANRAKREVTEETEDAVLTVLAPAGVGLLKANGTELPTFGKFDPMLVWGAPLALFSGSVIGGKMGRRLRAAGVGLLAVAANSAATKGSFRVEGDSIEGDDDDD